LLWIAAISVLIVDEQRSCWPQSQRSKGHSPCQNAEFVADSQTTWFYPLVLLDSQHNFVTGRLEQCKSMGKFRELCEAINGLS
jgi:hypothetical protein